MDHAAGGGEVESAICLQVNPTVCTQWEQVQLRAMNFEYAGIDPGRFALGMPVSSSGGSPASIRERMKGEQPERLIEYLEMDHHGIPGL